MHTEFCINILLEEVELQAFSATFKGPTIAKALAMPGGASVGNGMAG
jgi:hypothetical protein